MRQLIPAIIRGMVVSDPLKPEQWQLWSAWMRAQRLLTQEIDRRLQGEFGISKADFSVLVTLLRSPDPEVRVLDLADALGWEKSRVSHQLTRMEKRGLLERSESGASGRRTGIRLTAKGRGLTETAIKGHAENVRRFFFDPLSPEQAAAIRAWSDLMIDRLEPRGPEVERHFPRNPNR